MTDTTPPTPERGYAFKPDTSKSVNVFINYMRMLTGTMSQTGKDQYWADVDRRYENLDCKRCEANRDYLLKYSPVITFLSRHINQLGGNLDKDNIRCIKCEGKRQGGFDPRGGIILCANVMESRKMTEDLIAHEMVHAYDNLRWKVDWYGNLKHAACTEIRASMLSGECRFFREFYQRRQWKLTQSFQECVRRRATISVAARPFCPSDVEAAKVVNEVWDSCFRDTRPFDHIFQ